MKKLFTFTRKPVVSNRLHKGFASFSPWYNVIAFAFFGAWTAWLSEPTLKAWREADRVIAVHGFHFNSVILLRLLLVSACLLLAVIFTGASYKAIIDRLQ